MNPEPISQLADVDLPLPPQWMPWLVALISLVMIGIFLVWLALRLARTPRQAGAEHTIAANPEQALEQLLSQWHRNEISAREMAYRLATLLRLGLQLPQLESRPPGCIASHRERWPKLIRDLSAMRYQSVANRELHPEVLPLIRTWLREARARP